MACTAVRHRSTVYIVVVWTNDNDSGQYAYVGDNHGDGENVMDTYSHTAQ